MNGNFHSAPRIEILTNIFFACLTDHQSPAGQLRCAGQQYVDGATSQNVMVQMSKSGDVHVDDNY